MFQLRRAKEELEMMYITKYHELNEASKKMEDDFNHEIKLQEHKYSELQMKIVYMDKENASLKVCMNSPLLLSEHHQQCLKISLSLYNIIIIILCYLISEKH